MSAATKRAHENRSQSSLLHTLHFVGAPRAHLLQLFGALEAEHVLARDHTAVDENRQLAPFTAVYHGVYDFLADQVDLVVPLKFGVAMHRLRRSPVDGGERRCFKFGNVCLEVEFINLG